MIPGQRWGTPLLSRTELVISLGVASDLWRRLCLSSPFSMRLDRRGLPARIPRPASSPAI